MVVSPNRRSVGSASEHVSPKARFRRSRVRQKASHGKSPVALTGSGSGSLSSTSSPRVPDVAPVRDETPPPPPSGPRTSLGAGVVPPYYARIDWATLLRRVYLDDVLSCPCGGRRYVVAALPHEPRNERDAVVAIHTHLWVCSRHSALRACLIACASLASSMPAHAPCVKEFSPRKTTSSTRQHVRRRKHGLIGFSGRASGVCLIPACVTARP